MLEKKFERTPKYVRLWFMGPLNARPWDGKVPKKLRSLFLVTDSLSLSFSPHMSFFLLSNLQTSRRYKALQTGHKGIPHGMWEDQS